MARSANQKLKILYILKLLEHSDEAHPVTMKDILEELDRHGIAAERKGIYDDLDALREFGCSIAGKRGRLAGYYLEGQGTEPGRETKDGQYEASIPRWLSGDTKVELVCGEESAAVMREAFGHSEFFREKPGKKAGLVSVRLKVTADASFFGWLAGFGTNVRLTAPTPVIREYRKYLKEIRSMYRDE